MKGGKNAKLFRELELEYEYELGNPRNDFEYLLTSTDTVTRYRIIDRTEVQNEGDWLEIDLSDFYLTGFPLVQETASDWPSM